MLNRLKLIGVVALMFIGAATFAQSLNIKGGFSLSTIRSADYEAEFSSVPYDGGALNYTYDVGYLEGYHFALAYEFPLGNRLSLETGFRYQTRGHHTVNEASFESPTEWWSEKIGLKYKLSYVDLPIVLNTAITKGDLRIYARTGVYGGFWTTAKFKNINEFTSSSGGGGIYTNEDKLDLSGLETADRITIGLVAGVGAEYRGFYFETNYNRGIFQVSEMDSKFFTSDISFSLGYKLKFNP
jgi:hypothetical protein